jgi:hypothetical protein
MKLRDHRGLEQDDGFAPTPEMLAIVEAQALMESLA